MKWVTTSWTYFLPTAAGQNSKYLSINPTEIDLLCFRLQTYTNSAGFNSEKKNTMHYYYHDKAKQNY